MSRKKESTGELKQDSMTFTRLSSFLRCPMSEYYSYGVNNVGVETTAPYIPFIEGDFGHYAVAMFYKTGLMLRANLLKRAEVTIAEVTVAAGGLDPEVDEELRLSLAAMLGAAPGYRNQYKGDLDKYEVLFVEEPFEFQIGPYTIRGKVDRGLRDKKTGDALVWETKWVGGITQGAYAALPMSLQDLLYCEGFKQITGEYPRLMARDYIQKTRLRRRKDSQGGVESLVQYESRVSQQFIEEPDKMFWRPPPRLVEKQVVQGVHNHVENILKMREQVMQNPYMSFTCLGMYGTPCPFVQACTAKLAGHNDGWNAPECRGQYRLKPELHPELVKG